VNAKEPVAKESVNVLRLKACLSGLTVARVALDGGMDPTAAHEHLERMKISYQVALDYLSYFAIHREVEGRAVEIAAEILSEAVSEGARGLYFDADTQLYCADFGQGTVLYRQSSGNRRGKFLYTTHHQWWSGTAQFRRSLDLLIGTVRRMDQTVTVESVRARHFVTPVLDR
jgi:hypothetical protein